MKLSVAGAILLLTGSMTFAESECQTSQSCDERYSADMRIRYGHINDHNDQTKNANTLTGRLLLTLKTPQIGNFNAVFAAEHVNDFGIHTYNDGGVNGQTQYATEVDVSGTEMDEAFIQYQGANTQIRYGRQYINHGALPQRYLGTVAWRQNNQTYDALTVNVKANNEWLFEGAFVEKVYRVLGRDNPNQSAREWDIDGLGLRGSYETEEFGRITGYLYDLNFVDHESLSRLTYGLEAEIACGQATCKGGLAAQELDQDPGDSGQLLYAFASVGVNFSMFAEDNETGNVAFSITSLEGDGMNSFKTPLATLHGYAGSADKFLVHTPDSGLVDYEIRVKERVFDWDWTVALHRFTTTHQIEPKHYGSELDLAATRTFGKYKWIVKFANYRGNDEWSSSYGRDATKFWVQVQFKV